MSVCVCVVDIRFTWCCDEPYCYPFFPIPTERDFGDSMVPPSSIDSAILATSSSRAMDTAIEKHNERRNLYPADMIGCLNLYNIVWELIVKD